MFFKIIFQVSTFCHLNKWKELKARFHTLLAMWEQCTYSIALTQIQQPVLIKAGQQLLISVKQRLEEPVDPFVVGDGALTKSVWLGRHARQYRLTRSCGYCRAAPRQHRPLCKEYNDMYYM